MLRYHDSHLFIIDVSQSVEHDHPSAFDFLRTDLTNVDEFFARRGVHTLGLKRSFDFVTGRDKIGAENEADLMAEVKRRVDARGAEADGTLEAPKAIPEDPFSNLASSNGTPEASKTLTNDASTEVDEDAVFRHAYIPRTLNEVYDPERDVALVLKGEGDDLIYAGVAGVANKLPAPDQDPKPNGTGTDVRFAKGTKKFDGSEDEDEEGVQSGPSTSEDEDEDGSEDGEDGISKDDQRPRGHRFEDKEAKKERKKAVKEEQREKRQNKMPKSVKKRKVAKTSGKSSKR